MLNQLFSTTVRTGSSLNIATRVFAKKLAFLARVLKNSDSIGHHLYNCLLESSDEGSMQLLDGCSFLEELSGVEDCLQRFKEGSCSSREIRKELIHLDFSSLLKELKTHSSTSVAAEIAESLKSGTWLWTTVHVAPLLFKPSSAQ